MEYVPAKSIVYRDKSPDWFGTDYKMNIYRGCCHGCIYCDSRSDCYQIGDFDTVKAKENALDIIRDDLRRKVKRGVVVTGAASDPYNPYEKELLLTRHALELIDIYGFGAGIATKSPLIARDRDILARIAAHDPVIVKITVTCADDAVSRVIEPGVAVTSARFEAMRALADAGLYSGVLMMPLLPFINDTDDNVAEIVRLAGRSGARFIYPAFGLTMRSGQREYLYKALDASFPGVREKYAAQFGGQYSCRSPRAEQLWQIFKKECDAYGIVYRMADIIKGYRADYDEEQLTLF
ncbi:MAG: radical SAM protein [Oscillospiraceae bacterium]|jgi:DNA repair photolyase|nr:radical SAM protein [Oscillospiraceae bacterium]